VRRRWQASADRFFRHGLALAAAIGPQVTQGLPDVTDVEVLETIDAALLRRLVAQLATVRMLRAAIVALQRVHSLSTDLEPKIRDCGSGNRRGITIACGCRWFASDYTCRQTWLCWKCRRATSKKRGAKLEAALDCALAAERDRFACDADRVRSATFTPRRKGERRTARRRYGGYSYKLRHLDGVLAPIGLDGAHRPVVRIVMMTAAVRHDETTTVEECRERINRGLRYFRKKYHARWGRYPYAYLWEVTPGTDGAGHVHAHVALVIPWRPFKTMRGWFIAGVGGRRWCERVRFSWDYQQRGSRRRKASTPRSCSRYLAKYISKGVDVAGFTRELRAEIAAAFYNRRTISTSRAFWLPRVTECECCGEPFRIVAPDPVFVTCAPPQRGPPEQLPLLEPAPPREAPEPIAFREWLRPVDRPGLAGYEPRADSPANAQRIALAVAGMRAAESLRNASVAALADTEVIERQLIGILLHRPALIDRVPDLACDHFRHPHLVAVFAAMRNAEAAGEPIAGAEMRARMPEVCRDPLAVRAGWAPDLDAIAAEAENAAAIEAWAASRVVALAATLAKRAALIAAAIASR
jgi:hypothetical protein